jgi:hypothetical protein
VKKINYIINYNACVILIIIDTAAWLHCTWPGFCRAQLDIQGCYYNILRACGDSIDNRENTNEFTGEIAPRKAAEVMGEGPP